MPLKSFTSSEGSGGGTGFCSCRFFNLFFAAFIGMTTIKYITAATIKKLTTALVNLPIAVGQAEIMRAGNPLFFIRCVDHFSRKDIPSSSKRTCTTHLPDGYPKLSPMLGAQIKGEGQFLALFVH